MKCILLWLVLLFSANVRANIIDEYSEMSYEVNTKEENNLFLPVELGVDTTSGCICRATKGQKTTVCFGNYVCRKFPKMTLPKQSVELRVRTTVIEEILKGDLDGYISQRIIEIEANHKLKYIEPGAFQNLVNLEHLSISYNTALRSIQENTFEGLVNLRNLTLVNNGFTNIIHLTIACRPAILPALEVLDYSENALETIPENAFAAMEGTLLKKLDINLSSIDFIHENSFLPLKWLKELDIGDNDLNSSLISNMLIKMMKEGINLTHIDLSGLGFRKQPPRRLLDIIAQTTITRLNLARNQFETLNDDTFPRMANIELLDLRKVKALFFGPCAFNPSKFPNLKILLLGGNNLPGIHQKHLSTQLLLLDLSNNKGNHANPVYYEIDRDTFLESTELRVLNLADNTIKSIFDYTFRGLNKLKVLNLENGTIFYIGNGTFKATKRLEVLNLANNPLVASENLTSKQFDGLNLLRVLILKNCGLKRFYDDDNIFEMMPNITHLILRNNQLSYITAETVKPLKFLQVLDLSENLLITWWKPLFLSSGVKPYQILFTNNKISHFSISMLEDISYLLESNPMTDIEFMNNVFVCDCSSMYTTYQWLESNGSTALKNYFSSAEFQCSSPDSWEDRRVTDYLSTIKNIHCLMYSKISNIMIFVWTAPSLVTIALIVLVMLLLYKYRIYIRYWIFLTKIALGRKFIRTKKPNIEQKGHKYDAFISYCFDDRDFVMEMINNLENEPPYLKLCVSERDFEIGSYLSEAILTSINESKYVVLLISNNFAKSQWCRWEMQLAEYHRLFLEDGTSYDPLVLVRIGHVENKYLSPTLKYLLKTKIYLMWDDNHPEEFWKRLRDVLSKKK